MQRRKAILLILIGNLIIILGALALLAPSVPAAPLIQETITPTPAEPSRDPGGAHPHPGPQPVDQR